MVTTVSVEEYRKLLNDQKSTDEQIKNRLEYLEAFYRNLIQLELENYASRVKKTNEKPKKANK